MDIAALSASMPTDWIILGTVAALLSLDALRNGSGRALTLAASFPVALLLFSSVQHAAFAAPFIEQLATPLLQAALFLALVAMLFLALRRAMPLYGHSARGPIQALAAGVAGSATFVVVWLSVSALAAVWPFGSQVQAVFGEAYRFWWLIGAFGLLALVRA